MVLVNKYCNLDSLKMMMMINNTFFIFGKLMKMFRKYHNQSSKSTSNTER